MTSVPPYEFRVDQDREDLVTVTLEARAGAGVRPALMMALMVAICSVPVAFVKLSGGLVLGLLLSAAVPVAYLNVARRSQCLRIDDMFVSGEYIQNPLFNTKVRWEVPKTEIVAIEVFQHKTRTNYGAIFLRCSEKSVGRRVLTLQVSRESRQEVAQLIARALGVPSVEVSRDEIDTV